MKLMRLRHSRDEMPRFAAILPIGPTDDKQGSVATGEKAGLARFAATAHVIAPVTEFKTIFSGPSFRLSLAPTGHSVWHQSISSGETRVPVHP
jgi:hypothetical protein